MRKTLAIGIKEIRQVSRDPLSLGMLVGLPLFLLVLFGYALSFDVDNAPLAVQDRDLSAASRALVDAFRQSGRFEMVGWLPANADVEQLTRGGDVLAVLVIPEGYGTDLAAGRRGQVQFLLDGTDATTATTVLDYARGIVRASNGAVAREQLVAAGAAGALAAAIDVRPRVWYNPELESSQFLVPGLIAFILMLTTVLSTALSVVRERELGTLSQLRVAPLRTPQIILGKMLPYLGLSLVAVVLILTAARLLFEVEVRGPYLHLLAATLLYLAGGLGWGLLISTIAVSQAVAFQMSVLSSLLPALLLSGFVFPIRNMPEVLQAATYLVPARYYLIMLRGIILKGAGIGPYLDQFGYLAAYVAIVLLAASIRFGRLRG